MKLNDPEFKDISSSDVNTRLMTSLDSVSGLKVCNQTWMSTLAFLRLDLLEQVRCAQKSDLNKMFPLLKTILDGSKIRFRLQIQ